MAMNWKILLCQKRPRESTNPSGDARIEFERDFDRAIFSTPVKRLQDKAQVFPLEPHDAIRTRLTHSLEVSSVAKGLARATSKWLLDEQIIEPNMERSIESIAATCGLIHDLGNPPFGHSGEDAIAYWFEKRKDKLNNQLGNNEQLIQDFLKFDGNAQSLRLVTKLQILADFHGLNLTFGTLSASCKYIAPSHKTENKEKGGDHAKSKPGYFASENGIIEQIRKETGTGLARNPITYLVEAADDIVYSVADIEDAVKKGILTWTSVEKDLSSEKKTIIQSMEGMKRILQGKDGQTPENLPDDIYASAFRTAVISITVKSVVETFKEHYNPIMNGEPIGELIEQCNAWPLIEKLKKLAKKRVYCTPSNLKLELLGRSIICDLMDIFWEGAQELPIKDDPKTKIFSGKIGALLSENYRRVFSHSVENMSGLPETYHRLHLVTDYICGMTDNFAKRLHTELTNG